MTACRGQLDNIGRLDVGLVEISLLYCNNQAYLCGFSEMSTPLWEAISVFPRTEGVSVGLMLAFRFERLDGFQLGGRSGIAVLCYCLVEAQYCDGQLYRGTAYG